MLLRKKEMLAYIENFSEMPDRLLKYNEILLEGEDASPYCYQETMSYVSLSVAVTTHCNLSCRWCFRLDPKYKDALNKDMDIDVYRKFILNTKGRFRLIHLAGLGEPTLYPKLIEAIQLSKKLSDNIIFTSNGSLLTTEKIDKYVEAGLTHMEISIDSFDKEKLKEYRGVDLDYLYKIVFYISEKTPLRLQINSVVSTENYHSLKGLVRTFKEAKNIKVWHTIPLFETVQMHDQGIKPLNNKDYKKLLLDIEEEIRSEGLEWKLSPSSNGVCLDPVIEMKKKRNICFSCFEDPYIGVNGQFNFCARKEYCSSNVNASVGFEKAWNHPALLKFRKNMLNGSYPRYCGMLCFLKDKSLDKKSEKDVFAGTNK
jgi:MoaA/NifB/PqqE/SkfB family radical SAM enzyme